MAKSQSILVVGGGGREHAICWKLRRDHPTAQLHAAPGNPGIAELATCHAISPADIEAINALALALKVSLVVIGPEGPLAAGLADRLRKSALAVFGPSAAAARIESSKSFAKALMRRHGVPTAAASSHTAAPSAKRAARDLGGGGAVVIKASGLAAGKGVVVCSNINEADAAIDAMLTSGSLGESGSEILVEEFMEGEEISLFAVSDGMDYVLLPASQDHKRLLEGDQGPNTGGMGAYAPVSVATEEILERAAREIIEPTLAGMADEGSPFSGLLYAGLMLTLSGPRVVEFNCRFGDPETQVVLPLMSDDLAELLLNSSHAGGLAGARNPQIIHRAALTTIISAMGYPAKPQTGSAISLPSKTSDDSIIFHAGTTKSSDGTLVTAGGRVFAVTGIGDDLSAARNASQSAAAQIAFDGSHWRRDIGWRELARLR